MESTIMINGVTFTKAQLEAGLHQIAEIERIQRDRLRPLKMVYDGDGDMRFMFGTEKYPENATDVLDIRTIGPYACRAVWLPNLPPDYEYRLVEEGRYTCETTPVLIAIHKDAPRTP